MILALASITVNDSTFDVPLIAFTVELGINDTFFSRCNNLTVSSYPLEYWFDKLCILLKCIPLRNNEHPKMDHQRQLLRLFLV